MMLDFEMRHQYGVIDGMRLHWAEAGVASAAPPVVLLHGMTDSHRTWQAVAPLLAAHRHVLMPDLLGCGLSERPDASYKLAWHASVISAWLLSLGIESADFVGHSFGGGVAQMLLLERPMPVRRLALVAPGGMGRGVGRWLHLAGVAARMVESFGQPFMALGTRLAVQGGALSKEEIGALCVMNSTPGSARAFARTAQDVINWRGQRRLFLDRAHEVDVLPPIAMYWGDRDKLIPVGQGAALMQAVKGVTLQPFPGCGHFLHHEQPQQLVTALCEFFDTTHAEPACIRRVKRAQSWRAQFARQVGAVTP